MSRAKQAVNAEIFPLEIKRGSITVKIYRTTNDGKPEYTLIHYNRQGERKRETTRDLEALKARAGEVLDDLSAARSPEEGALTAAEREEFAQLRAILSEVKAAPLVAARHFVEAVKLLGSDLVIEAARYYARQRPKGFKRMSVAEVCDEFRTARSKKSDGYQKDLKYRFQRFSEFCGTVCIADVTSNDLIRFFDELGMSPRSKNNFRLVLSGLFNFARKKKYLPADWNELNVIEREDDCIGHITTYTPQEIATLLSKAEPHLAPALALGAFAGLRTCEILRLDWNWVNFETGFIIIPRKRRDENGKVIRISKTGRARQVPMLPNLRAWLEAHRKESGLVFPHGESVLHRDLRLLCQRNGLTPKRNALRHSFISYRTVEVQNVHQVALECDNSTQVIFAHYLELVTPRAAKLWFSVAPGVELDKVLEQPQQAAVASQPQLAAVAA